MAHGRKKAPAGYRWKTVTKLNALGRGYTTHVLVPLDSMESKFKEAEQESYKAYTPYPGQAVDPDVDRTPVRAKPTTRASAAIKPSVVKTPTNLLGQALDPIKNIPIKAEEHRLAGIQAIKDTKNPFGQALGGLQWLASPISGTVEALWDKPVSDNLQNAGMSKKAADNVALYSGTLLPFVGQVKNVANIPKAINLAVKNTSKTKHGQQAVNDLRDGVNSALTNTKVEDVLHTATKPKPATGYKKWAEETAPPSSIKGKTWTDYEDELAARSALADDTATVTRQVDDFAVPGSRTTVTAKAPVADRIVRDIGDDTAGITASGGRVRPAKNLADDVSKTAPAISSPSRLRRRFPQAAAVGTAAALVPSRLGDGEPAVPARVGGSGYQQWDKEVQDSIQPDATMGGGPQDRSEAYAAQVGGQPRTNNIGGQPATEEQMSWAEKYYGAKFARDPAARYKKNKEFKQSLWKKMAILNAIAALTGNTSQAEQYATYALGMHEDAMQFDDDMRMHKMHKAVYFRPDGTFDPPKNSEAAYNRAIQIGASPDEAKEVYGFTPTKKSKDQYHRVDPNDPTKWEHKRFDVGDDVPEDWIKGKSGSSSPVTTYAPSKYKKINEEKAELNRLIQEAEASGQTELANQYKAELETYTVDDTNQSTNFQRLLNAYRGKFQNTAGYIPKSAPKFKDWVGDTGPDGGAWYAENFESNVNVPEAFDPSKHKSEAEALEILKGNPTKEAIDWFKKIYGYIPTEYK